MLIMIVLLVFNSLRISIVREVIIKLSLVLVKILL